MVTESTKKNEEIRKVGAPPIPYIKLYRYADAWDCMLILAGTLAGIVHGAGLPVAVIFFGELTTRFTIYGRYQLCNLSYNSCFALNYTTLNESQWIETIRPKLESFKPETVEYVYWMIYVACGVFALGIIQVGAWSLQALRQTKIIRIAYFRSILRQEIAYHDLTSSGELNARLLSDIKRVMDGMGDKISFVIQHSSTAVVGFAIAFVYSWKLTLVTLTIAPFLGLSSALLLKISDVYTKKELEAYAKGGSVAEEAISAIKTVTAFGCQEKVVERYVQKLNRAKKVGIRRGFMTGLSIGLMYLSIFGMYALSFWYGTTLVLTEETSIGALTICFFSILVGSYSLGTAGSYFGSFSDAKAGAAKIFEVTDRIPDIDIFSNEGKDPSKTSGEIKFKDVFFSYPSRPQVEVLKGASFSIDHGKTTALVGQSGSGKSTITHLIQRFYDVSSGSIQVGGKMIDSVNLKKHRELIGVVAQEPVLFYTTIAENIRWGRKGITDEEVHEAAKTANAYNFIMELPKKFETLVGEGGGQMSGGQKQRIAIARAIARNPKILLLDEATSALDSGSEAIVQSALEKASAGRTTVVIAHRLSTIRNADKIIALVNGKVKEQGTHDELLQIPDGLYKNLIDMQAGKEEKYSDEDDTSGPRLSNADDGAFLANGRESFKRSLQRRSRRSRRSQSVRSNIQRKNSFQLVSPIPGISLRASMRNKDAGLKRSVVERYITKDEEEEQMQEDEELTEVPLTRILKMNKPEWGYMAAGLVFAAIAGSIDPLNAVVYSEVLRVFTESNREEQYRDARLHGLIFLGIGLVAFLSYLIEGTLFAKSGMELTTRLRHKALNAILRQEIAYFDNPINSTSFLIEKLSADASRVKGCTGVRIGTILKNFSTLAVSLGIAFAYGWKLALVILAFIPFIALSGYLELHFLTRAEEDDGDDDAGKISVEAISNIRTVASLTREQEIYDLYVSKLAATFKQAAGKAILIGVGYGFSQCVLYFAYGATFRLGIELIIIQEITFDNVFRVLTAVVFGGLAIGQNSSLAPDYAEAKVSASKIFALLDRTPKIDSYSKEGLCPAHCRGELKFKVVNFRYPCRSDVPVLRDCNIIIKPGQTVALVGKSGCGKSTAVQLLMRFYDPDQGQILLDDMDIRNLNVSWLRQQIGLVAQEPVLFDQSIEENIMTGDCSRTVTTAEVESVAESANIHSFISTLPSNYFTIVGNKGGQLSGGQKQRVAIARALLRDPKILLLDEATSALDTESERIVQSALDIAKQGRTCIVVAHRLSTMKHADQIVVLDSGSIAEAGTHEELIAKKGAYFSLVNSQMLTENGVIRMNKTISSSI
ncbi:ATP-dependent translocase ABCB1-like isoform X2 [Clavelina lepadiformis]|uniref:ATP-dependent translocase ABCB1-like isoform X2 n=1 Tax=Clavelina lepadiformis TaxID=159417 RepID=UPI0040427C44